MPRIYVNLGSEDKAWLDHEARRCRVPVAELVRQAVHALRLCEETRCNRKWQRALRDTAGIWQQTDGLACQQRLRDEWYSKE